MSANRTGQQISTEYLAPLISIAWSLPFSPSVSSSLAVGESTHVAEYTSVRALSTSPDASANGVTHAVPRNPVITSASVLNARLADTAAMNENPL